MAGLEIVRRAPEKAAGKAAAVRASMADKVRAVCVVAAGGRVEDAAAEASAAVGATVTPALVRKWLADPKLQGVYRATLGQLAAERYARAVELVDRQLSDPSPFVAQQAARLVIEQTREAALGVDDSEIHVIITGAPELGMPGDS